MAYSNKKIRNKYQFLVWKFLSKPEECSWPKEIKISKALLSKYPNIMFWKWLELVNAGGFGYKLNSLAYFLTTKGKVLLYNKNVFYKNSLNASPQQSKRYELKKKRVGVNRKVNKKLKLFDFIRHGKKEKN